MSSLREYFVMAEFQQKNAEVQISENLVSTAEFVYFT